MNNQNGTTKKMVKLPHLIADKNPYTFYEQIEKFEAEHKVLQKHYSFSAVMVGAQKVNIPGFQEMNQVQAQVQIISICYLVYETTEDEAKKIKQQATLLT